jgi:hypothetical protein
LQPAPTVIMARQGFEGLMRSRQGVRQVSNIMPPQRSHGAGQQMGSGHIVVAPHAKQIQAWRRMRSSGPANKSGRPRRSISSRSFMAQA